MKPGEVVACLLGLFCVILVAGMGAAIGYRFHSSPLVHDTLWIAPPGCEATSTFQLPDSTQQLWLMTCQRELDTITTPDPGESHG